MGYWITNYDLTVPDEHNRERVKDYIRSGGLLRAADEAYNDMEDWKDSGRDKYIDFLERSSNCPKHSDSVISGYEEYIFTVDGLIDIARFLKEDLFETDSSEEEGTDDDKATFVIAGFSEYSEGEVECCFLIELKNGSLTFRDIVFEEFENDDEDDEDDDGTHWESRTGLVYEYGDRPSYDDPGLIPYYSDPVVIDDEYEWDGGSIFNDEDEYDEDYDDEDEYDEDD